MEKEILSKLKEKYKELPDEQIIEMLSSGKDAYEEGVWDLIVAEAMGRNLKIPFITDEFEETKEAKKPELVKQHPSVIKATVFIILSLDIFGLLMGITGIVEEISRREIISFIWDIFFSYHLLKLKEWARKWTIARAIIAVIIFSIIDLPQENYFELGFYLAFMFLIFFLLFGKGSRKKAIITTSVYAVLLLSLASLAVWATYEEKKTGQIIQNIPVIQEQKSNKGFKVVLPSNSWRFVAKEKRREIIGDYAEDADIVITHVTGKVQGIFRSEDISENVDELFLDRIANYFRTELLNDFNIYNEDIYEKAIIFESKYKEFDTDYAFTCAFKALTKKGITCYFLGELETYNSLTDEIITIIDDLAEISVRQFLPKISAKEIFKRNNEAVVLIRIYDKNGEMIGFGSGFNIREDGLILTNLHNLTESQFIDVKFPLHGSYDEVYIAGIDRKLCDLAILKIDGKNLPVVQFDDFEDPEVGEEVTIISNPEGLVNTISKGIISGIRDFDDCHYLQVTAPISHGSSGGSAFDQYGNLIGVCVLTLDEGQNLNFLISVKEIYNIEFFENFITLAQFQKIISKYKK